MKIRRSHSLARLLGPAFIAAIAYVDPGNVAANITAGARYGYLLVWVLVLANLMAVAIQYQSAKLGLVTGKSLPEMVGNALPRWGRITYWIQAELVALATDIAEIIGGAIALQLLFGFPLLWGGIITAAVSMVLLALQSRRSQTVFEFVIMGMLLMITCGFLAGLFIIPPAPDQVAAGLVPRFDGTDSVLVAAGMLGATVMPHAIYLHSSLVVHRHGADAHTTSRLPQLLKATRWDVVLALLVAGAVNIGLLLLAASALQGVPGTDDIGGAHAAIESTFGKAVGTIFALGLLASGLASTSVGAYAGSEIMKGLLRRRIPLLLRRLVTLVPALLLLTFGINPTQALLLSQVVLSFGIPFALVPLVRMSGNRKLMGEYRDGALLRIFSWTATAVIIALNIILLVLTIQGT
ncbi:Nramp family divalent metal transporter [uncultured Rothia sp.]|uniref:Nramp family divalent metal transporter n=1 Tax=uncultured Rothia sp. TaxID=316088 RepID=UPI003217F30B